MPNLFREYVTEQAFVISLRKTHIWVLAHVAEGDHAKRDQKDIAADAYRLFTATPSHERYLCPKAQAAYMRAYLKEKGYYL